MTKIKDIIRLKKDIVFGGAVQTEWFYEDKAKKIAENFVFHGLDYFGVTEDDVAFKTHKLMDTCTYTGLLSDRLYSDEGNPIILTIAGYGTGKSHLSVTLGTLFSEKRESPIVKKIISNIKGVSSCIGKDITDKIDKPNLVIVLNGMKDFNLNYEIISCTKKALKRWGYNDEIFSEFTKAYNIAYRFLDKNFETFECSFKKYADERGICKTNLKDYMKENIYQDNVFDCINEVYNEVNGDYIRWDEGISAAEVLTKLSERLCSEKGQFNKILILFDEFGRYIEYASEYPNRAGDSALQQLFEAVQDSENKIIFNAFIQSDLKTYLSRVNKTSNISRYIGRYEAGEKIYLSSNLETIFANLIDKYDKILFNHNIKEYFNRESVEEYNRKVFTGINTWSESARQRGIWSNYEKFKNVILQGIYPMNPISTWLITYLSDWYQQRSALNFLIKSFEKIEEKDVYELGDLPEIKAIDIIKGDLFEELLLAENEGRQKSEYCIIYDKILIKYKDKLKTNELDVLAGILVLKLCKFKTKNIEDLNFSLEVITGITGNILVQAISELEDTYGIIGYDERNNTYDFIEDATGKSDFLRVLRKKKNSFNISMESLFNIDALDILGIEKVINSDFSKRNFIKTNEWKYISSVVTANNFTELQATSMIKEFNDSTGPEKPKGKLVYIYNNEKFDIDYMNTIIKIYNNKSLDKYPFIFVLLDDKDNELYDTLVDQRISKNFTQEENIKYGKYIARFINDTNEKLKDIFKQLMLERLYITKNGIEKIESRLQSICNNKFLELYPNAVPFDFAGFDNKIITVPKKIHSTIAKNIVQNAINYQTLSVLPAETINRIKAVLENSRTGWGVLSIKSSNVSIISPTNMKVKQIFNFMDELFYKDEELCLSNIMKTLTSIPFGLNDYSATLLISVYILGKFYEAKLYVDNEIINNTEWANEIFTEKAISYSKLNKTKLLKINIEGYKKAFQNICLKIDVNRDVDDCIGLKRELDKLLKETEPPEEFKEKIEGCSLILDEGIRLYNKVNDKLGRLNGRLDKAKEGNDFKDIILLIDETESINSIIEENSRFVYNEKYEKSFLKVNKICRNLVESKYEDFLNKNCRCKVVEQATRFESWMELMRKTLQKIGYQELAMKTKSKLTNELDNLQLIRERQNVEQNIQLFLNKKVTKFLTQEELISLDKDGKKLLDNLDANTKIGEIDKVRLVKNINLKREEVNLLLDEIKEKLTEIYDLIDDINEVEEVRVIKSKIDYILSKKLRPEDKSDIEDIGNCIQNFLNDINDIVSESDILIRCDLAKQVQLKYTDNDYVNLENVINNYIELLEMDVRDRSALWGKKYLNYKVEDIMSWDSNLCYTWLDTTASMPSYIQQNEKDKYSNLHKVVVERTTELKVKSILVIFEKMNKMEKEACIKELSKYI